jgi:polyketide cyclase/dehydrase/lipid transport protein
MVIETLVEPAVALAFVANPANETKWNPSAIRAEPLSPSPVRVGSSFTLGERMMGREMAVDVTVVEFDPPQRVRSRSSSGPMCFDTTHIVESTGAGASVTMSVAVAVKGPLRLAAPLIRWGFSRRVSRLAPRLKAAIEAYAATAATGRG